MPRGEVSLRLPRSRDTSAERPRAKGRSRPTDSLTAARDGKPWETVGNLGKDRKSRMWNSASEELRSECAWLSWCHPQNCKKSRCCSFKWTKNVAKCVFREFLQLLQQNYLSFPALVPVGLASQCWIPELLKGRHWRIQPGTAQRCVQNLLVVFKAAGDLLDLDFH